MTDDPSDKLISTEGIRIPTTLPSGRRIAFEATERGEELRIVAPDGSVEVVLELTPTGPVLRLTGARLQIDSTESISMKCKSFALETSESVQFKAGGLIRVESSDEIRLKSGEQTFIDADYVNLNCLDRKGYHDEGVPAEIDESETVTAPQIEPPQSDHE